jgi:hypothetical protein
MVTNVTASVKGSILHLEIDLSAKGKDSASGKSSVIASTGGNIELKDAPGVKLGLNLYTPAKL